MLVDLPPEIIDIIFYHIAHDGMDVSRNYINFEHIDKNPLEALETMGASKWQVFAFGVVPQIMPSFMGNNFYILDRNIRMATMLGIVGAGGIGYELQSSFRMFNYERVSAIIILIFISIFVIDKISSYIREKLL